ncbi:peptidase [Megasphaera cerevisiae DSM 20462]|jgi:amidohydrolase|uniref:Peptidase n=1 Tax=Megasphaera cerevisiae DSM 20462 TaxID=1122219 RepID=A0A0J6WVI2_9FIRM|nr:amidohydrolase [Megasphaera cerevisiae]KMO85827.1 peptidase [Megasphaera cerevisiae DSM 20462]SKA08934.1 amidohydrolase [Megasphaera cerevisiae DSM 20462]
MRNDILKTIQQYAAELVAIRRHCHQYPELSRQETNTLNFIENKLNEYGIANRRVDKGGIIGWIDGKKAGKTILLRADIDALPIDESEANLSGPRVCISRNPGVMHACGHDGHIAMGLIAAKVLHERKEQWNGKIILMFEQGEEESGPLAYLLRFLEKDSGWHIDACYATHVRWDIPTGKIAVCHGSPMAGGFGFKIKIKGHGGHGSRPDLAESPIDCFHDFYGNLQALRLRSVSPMECLSVSVGSIHSGNTLNVIPNDLTFAGTCRFFNYDKAGKRFYEEFLHLLKNACDSYNCTYEILHMPLPLFEVQNNETCVAIAEAAVKKYIGEDILYPCEPWMASESFAITSRLYPGVLTFTGIANKAKGSGANHHTPEFDLDEDSLIFGTAACVGYALDFLQKQPVIIFQKPTEPLEDLVSRNI